MIHQRKANSMDAGVCTASQPPYAKKLRGFTLIEMIIALAIAGILLGIGVVSLRAPAARLYAQNLRALVQEARYEAIKTNRPVAVLWDAANTQFVSRYEPGSTNRALACTGSSVLDVASTADFRDLELSDGGAPPFTFSIVWLPTGRAVDCDGSPSSIKTIEVGTSTSPTVVTVTISVVGGVDLQ